MSALFRFLAQFLARSVAPCRALAFGLTLALAGATACRGAPDAVRSARWPTPRRGLVVSEHPLATAAGVALLEAGGNAVDAAVACALTLAVVHPQAGNLGGGGFALYVPHDTKQKSVAFDFRERAPAALRPELFLREGVVDAQLALSSALSAGVPGSPRGLWQLQRGLGLLSFEQVAEPALRLARDGFALDAVLARDLRVPAERQKLAASPGARALFYPGGEPLSEGQILRQPELARTLELLVEQGPDGFYQGPVAEALLAEVEAGGGVMSAEDLRLAPVIEREPLRGWFRGFEILTMPPPSSGGIVLLQVLSILDGFPLDAERELALAERAAMGASQDGTEAGAQDLAAGLSSRGLHWWIEAMRCAYADRAAHMGDPDFYEVPVEALLSAHWIATRRVQIGEQAAPGVAPWSASPRGAGAGAPLREGQNTTHLSVLDAQGNALSLTTTLNQSFGSGILVRGAGFLLNDEMDDFSIQAGTPNAYGLVGGLANELAPGKCPLSSMTPTVLRDNGNTVAMVIGSPGGPRIISTLIEVLLRRLVYGQSLAQAIAAPRLHQQYAPLWTEFEAGFEPSLMGGLKHRGQELKLTERRWGSVQAIEVEPGGEPVGVSDPRSGGAAMAQGGAK